MIIEITKSSKLIDIWIPRELNLLRNISRYSYASEFMANNTAKQLFPISITTKALNSSIHLELSPTNTIIGYFVSLKFNMTPIINSTFQDYDCWNIFCPSGNLTILNTQIFKFI